MEFITGLLWNPDFPFLTFFAPAFALAYWWIGGLWDRPERKDVVVWLKHDRSRYLYRHLIERALDTVSGFLGRREVRVRHSGPWNFDQTEYEILNRNRLAWSWGLLDFALLIAVAYPVFSMMGQWAVVGEGKIGSLTILPQTDWDDRWFPLFLLTCSGFAYVWALSTRIRWLRALFVPAIGFYFWFSIELDAIEGVLAGALALAGAFAFAIAIAGAVAIAIAGPVAIAIASAVAGAFASAVAGAFAFAIAGVLAVAIAGAVDWARVRLEQKMARPSLALLGWLSVLFMGLLIASVWSQPTDATPIEGIAAFLLFLGFLPLLNAVADFASTGLTRYFLARGAAGHPGWFGLVDIVAGAATFFGLGFAMIGTVALVKALGGPKLIDLGVLLGPRGIPDAILTDPNAYWWLYLTFLSTLLPTVIHGFIATFVFVLIWPERLRMWLAKNVDVGGYLWGRLACLALTVLMALSVALPLTLLYYLGRALAVYYPHAGEVLIQIFRWFAVLTGAI